MSGMSKKKPSKPEPEPQPEPAKKDHHRSPHMVRLSADLFAAIKSLADENERPLTREIKLALIAWLEAKGKWPPATST